MAKNGAEKVDVDVQIAVPMSFVKQTVKEKTLEMWQTEWFAYNHGRQTKQFFPYVHQKITKQLLTLTRHEVSRIVRLITGHNSLNYHMSLTTPGTDPMCRFCRTERETFYHFIKECPRLRSYRAQCFDHYEGPALPEWEPEDILKFSRLQEISCLLYTSDAADE